MSNDTTSAAIAACEAQAKQHYENFPTASRLLARPQRRATAIIYSFARTADDIVDEGNFSKSQRHRLLNNFYAQLEEIKAGRQSRQGLFMALAEVIRQFDLPITPFENLLSAFRDDIEVQRYASRADLLDYCRRSANPVGELVLRLHGYCTAENLAYSDRICTALQLINFIQDLDSDCQLRQRLYIPLDELNSAGIGEEQLRLREDSPALAQLVEQQIASAESLLYAGIPLLDNVGWRLRQVLKLTLLGGVRIIEKLRKRESVFTRPVLTKADLILLVLRSIYSSHLYSRGKIRK